MIERNHDVRDIGSNDTDMRVINCSEQSEQQQGCKSKIRSRRNMHGSIVQRGNPESLGIDPHSCNLFEQ